MSHTHASDPDPDPTLMSEGVKTNVSIFHTGFQRDATGLLTDILFEVRNTGDIPYSIVTDDRLNWKTLHILSDDKFIKEPVAKEYVYVPHPFVVEPLPPNENLEIKMSIVRTSEIESKIIETLDVVELNALIILGIYPESANTDFDPLLEQLSGRLRLQNIKITE